MTKHILKTEGVRGLFRGFLPTVAREMPGYFFFFGGYEMSRKLLTPPGGDPDKDLGEMTTLLFLSCSVYYSSSTLARNLHFSDFTGNTDTRIFGYFFYPRINSLTTSQTGRRLSYFNYLVL